MIAEEYNQFLIEIKNRVSSARYRAVLAVNRELIMLYWHIGNEIKEKQRIFGWGSAVVDKLSHDLSIVFPEIKGFSPRNLKYMKAFAVVWKDLEIVQRTVALIPWRSNIAIIEKVKNPEERLWYAVQCIEHGWTKDFLVHQIETDLYSRKGKAITNFERVVPANKADYLQNIVKNPYFFDFIDLEEEAEERELENSLIDQLCRFLQELGPHFAFIGRQFHLEVDGQDFYIDLLFYHTRLHRYLVIDLKIDEFKPEYAGKMAFYLNIVNRQLKSDTDEKSIGLILCKDQNKIVAEYTLSTIAEPMAVAEYRVGKSLPKDIRDELPSILELETSLQPKALPRKIKGNTDDNNV